MKQSSLISTLTAMFFSLILLLPSTAMAADIQNIGVMNRQQVVAAYPGIQEIFQQLQDMRTAAQNDYNTKSKGLSDDKRRTLNDTIAQQEAQKEAKLMNPVENKISAAVKAVAADKGLTIILDAADVVYGGTDITNDVIAKIK
ncbi:OmpH family outer membrane protein [Pectinatus frisingensis]|uniref:OmpH family outer membrane protein n=1 Tax=Pectinatus frisingensis TaxID=865 RepID=UPI0018C58E42|nr:OmpH family outer membrane protein [Pectinatus frisingensis]